MLLVFNSTATPLAALRSEVVSAVLKERSAPPLSGEVANYMAASANQNLASFPALLKILKIKNKDICFYFELSICLVPCRSDL